MIQNKSFILALLLAVCCTLTAQAGLVNYWTFDADGTDAVTGNAGTFIGDAAVTTAAGEPCIGSGALKVAHNTSDDYFDVAYKVVPDHSIYTITGWYKWDTSFSANAVDDRAFLYETTPQWSSGLGSIPPNSSPLFGHTVLQPVSALINFQARSMMMRGISLRSHTITPTTRRLTTMMAS